MTFFYDLNKRLAALADKQDLHESKVAESEKWIQKAVNPAHKGNLHKALHVAQDKTIPKAKIEKATHSKNPKLRHMAQFAKNVANEDQVNELSVNKLNDIKGSANRIARDERMSGGDLTRANKAERVAGQDGVRANDQVQAGMKANQKQLDELSPAALKSYDKKSTQDVANRIGGMTQGNEKDFKKIADRQRGAERLKTRGIAEGHCSSCGCSPCECVEEGNAFTDKLKATAKGGKFKMGNKEYTDTSDIEEGFEEMNAWLKSREKEKGTGRFDKRKVSTGTVYTRKPETFDEPDDEVKSDEPKRKGRPKGKDKGPERVTAKAWKHKGERKSKTKEDLDSDGVMMTRPSNMSSEGFNPHEYDQEGAMAKGDMHTVIRHAEQLEQHLQDAENLPTWVIEKLGQIKGMMTSVSDYIISSHERGAEQATGQEGIREPELDEEKVEAGKREFFDRLAPAAKKAAKVIKVMARDKSAVEEESTDKEDTKAERAGKKVTKDIEYDEGDKGKDDNKAEKAGKKVAKDIEYDDKKDRKEKKTESAKPDFLDVDKDGDKKEPFKKAAKDKEEKVEETTVAGSVAPAQNSAPKAGKGMQFGKGVYEGFNKQFTQALNESISIESKMQECGDGNMEPGITITADGEEAAKLMMLLKLAGLENQIPKACPSCGGSPCGCAEVVDENSPDWPTNTEKLDADPNLRTYSGGLNGPKSTGQSTTVGGGIPNIQLRRQASMEESVALERSLFKTWKNYKG